MALPADRSDGVEVLRSRAARLVAVASVVAAAAALAGTLSGSAVATTRTARTARTARTTWTMRSLDHEVFTAVNAFRAKHHLSRLLESPHLTQSARAHSDQMARLGYFAHPSANGTSFWRRIAGFYGSRGYGYWSVGENLLWAAPEVSAPAAMKMWIASPEHLRNLLTPQWRRLGVSAVHVHDAPGVFHGLDVTIITTDFGVRR